MASTWLLPSFIEEPEYVLDINSSVHVEDSMSPVQFTVKVADIKSTDKSVLFLNPDAKVALGAFIMPNNVEMFPVIDTVDNQSSAFFSMRLAYEDSESVHDYAVNYFDHGVCTTNDAIEQINRGLKNNFLETNNPASLINVCGEVFTTNCFHAHRDNVTDFIHLQTFTLGNANPFREVYEKTAKAGTPKKVKQIDMVFG